MQEQEQLSPVHITNNDGRINGFVQLKNTSSLELFADFEYTISSPHSDSKPEVLYRLNETRPIKLNEIYYLDHPKFGVVAKITVP
ncbi:CsiV family protein [Crenothrix sp.]|uniref:CsiV family protein n=1 Tax=Crenothrix sp. TaxID=3100433 RepID=UPI00374D8EDF